MKKIIAVLVFVLALSVCASAQRERYNTINAGLTVSFLPDEYNSYEPTGAPGIYAAYGIRNFNREAFISFAYQAEAHVYTYCPDRTRLCIGAAPEIGVAIGPKWLKWYNHAGLTLDYWFGGGLKLGFKSGSGFDIGKHFMVDGSYYLPFGLKQGVVSLTLGWKF